MWIYNVPVEFDLHTINIINITAIMVHKHYFVPKPPPSPSLKGLMKMCTEQVGIPDGWQPLYHTQPFS